MKVAVYVRVSTGKQDADNQKIDLLKYIDNTDDWELYQVYEDTITGKSQSRPAFDALFVDAHRKLFNVVLFWDLSRFSRAGMAFTLQKLTELENLNIQWHSYSEPYLNTTNELTRMIVLAVLSSVAKAEREKISERTKAGLRRARAEGKKLGRPAKKQEFNEVTEIECLRLYDKGLSEREIAKELNTSRYRVTKALAKSSDFKGW